MKSIHFIFGAEYPALISGSDKHIDSTTYGHMRAERASLTGCLMRRHIWLNFLTNFLLQNTVASERLQRCHTRALAPANFLESSAICAAWRRNLVSEAGQEVRPGVGEWRIKATFRKLVSEMRSVS